MCVLRAVHNNNSTAEAPESSFNEQRGVDNADLDPSEPVENDLAHHGTSDSWMGDAIENSSLLRIVKDDLSQSFAVEGAVWLDYCRSKVLPDGQ